MATHASSSWSYEITGPGLEGKRAPCFGAALALAVDRASRLEAPGSFYVRDAGVIAGRADGDGAGRGRVAPVETTTELEAEQLELAEV
jgi:hypothetical protein